MNCELMLTYDTPALRQTGSRNLTGQKTLPTIWGTYMNLVTKYQISAINSCWEKCDEKWSYMFNVYRNQLSRQTGSRNRWQVSYSVNHTIYLYLVSININCTNNVDVTHCVLILICVFCFVTMYVVFCIYFCVSLYFVLLFCSFYYTLAPRRGRGVYCLTSVLPSA
jgi:hypothetical protein